MKNYVLLIFFACSVNLLFSQIGIKGGFNVSNISTDDDNAENLKSKLGYQVGVLYDHPLSETIWLASELVLTSKGADYNLFENKVKSRMTYLDIPITLAYRHKLLPIGIHAGPQFSYLLRSDVKYKGTSVQETIDRENFEDIDIGVALGFNLQINDAFLEFRYTRSFKNYEKSYEVGDLSIEPASKHHNFQISLGVFL